MNNNETNRNKNFYKKILVISIIIILLIPVTIIIAKNTIFNTNDKTITATAANTEDADNDEEKSNDDDQTSNGQNNNSNNPPPTENDYNGGTEEFTTNSTNKPPKTPASPTLQKGSVVINPCIFNTTTTDPDGDQLYYKWDWGDNTTSAWLGPYESGWIVYASHKYSHAGIYEVKVKAKDTNGLESSWSATSRIQINSLRFMIAIIDTNTKK